MDGRRFRWFVSGLLLASAVGCRNKPVYTDVPGVPKPGLTAATPTKPVAGGVVPGNVTDPLYEAAQKAKKSGPPGPDTEVHFAKIHENLAFADPPPLTRDEHLDTARSLYQRALKKDPKHGEAMLGLARLYARLGDRDRSAEAYRKYLELYPKNAEVCHEVALLYGRWKDWAGAAAWCEAALRLDPENRTYRKTMGFCLARAGQWEKAFGALCAVVPEAQARYDIARVMDDTNQAAASRQQLQLALQADPNFAPAREALAELDAGSPAGEPGSPVPSAAPNPVVPAGYAREP
jgi:tetratricopeptide (TPR) repeat protein